jgi:hypothetical protein
MASLEMDPAAVDRFPVGGHLGSLPAGQGARAARISGTLQLAVSSRLAVAGFSSGGIATAMFLFHVPLNQRKSRNMLKALHQSKVSSW